MIPSRRRRRSGWLPRRGATIPANGHCDPSLHLRGLRFRLHRQLLANSRRTVDIVFPRARTAIFLDGCFWHGCPKHRSWPKNNAEWWRRKIEANIARDRDTDRRLRRQGWKVVRIWEHEAIEAAVDRIELLVRPAINQVQKVRR